MQPHDVAEIVSIWAVDRSLSRRKKAFLETIYNQFIEADGMGSPNVMGHAYASELDLPPGSCTIQVVAALLDHLEPLPGPDSRLVEVTEELVEFGHISREAADVAYEAAL